MTNQLEETTKEETPKSNTTKTDNPTTTTTPSTYTAASTTTSTDGPKTGDDSHMILWALIAAACALAGGVCGYYGVFRKKKDEAEEGNQNPDEKEDSNDSDSGNAKVNSGNEKSEDED